MRVLICTDVGARGVDLPNVHMMVNMTLPDRATTYVHRYVVVPATNPEKHPHMKPNQSVLNVMPAMCMCLSKLHYTTHTITILLGLAEWVEQIHMVWP